jgi:hypothetical protein
VAGALRFEMVSAASRGGRGARASGPGDGKRPAKHSRDGSAPARRDKRRRR